ncbi:hypothetical protein DMB38_12910 [Streptomyces sp. WAC 06738]|uniref:hypothetical protein n=1 Tax=Streptomyces sp. WAC 06738 TaxID=2203210 RepID=UPI000F719C6B|nr:hypothetical protein [Streptomyces sp. WAC 06738]AZM46594.1 hypothetical protein DMB38_12910 [Streptomyces sp. WAC 06738]
MPQHNPRAVHFARTGAAQAAGRHAATIRKQRDELRAALDEILDRFTGTSDGQYTAAATAEDLERWRKAGTSKGTDTCSATFNRPNSPDEPVHCIVDAGHPGPHISRDGDYWGHPQ